MAGAIYVIILAMKTRLVGIAVLLAASLAAEPICIGEVCYPSREAAIEAGALPPDGLTAAKAGADDAPAHAESPSRTRVAFGYMGAPQFISFLNGENESEPFADKSVIIVVLLVLLGGLVTNLTPCVLPLVPVNVAILIGRGESSRVSRIVRGVAYGGGMAAAYGALGLAAAFGGMAFGTVQSSAWFNLAVAAVFIVLGLGMLDVVNMDVAAMWRRYVSRKGTVPAARPASRGIGGAFLLGAGAAVLAGACVQPILMAVLVYTVDGFAAGRWWTVSLPFVLGVGMGLPWLFVAAGLSVLPRPGAWMVWVKRIFALVIFAMAAWYAYLAWTIWQGGQSPADRDQSPSALRGQPLEATPATWEQALGQARVRNRPILVDIWATWCKNCFAMEKSTFKNAEVVRELKKKFTVIRLQIEDFSELAKVPELKSLDIKGIPAFVILDERGLSAAASRPPLKNRRCRD